ncbi:MAG: polysaccharide lyase 8 family protein [Cyclobacteriaceae bacterium]|nr:polysaccharide lyase 8 family protein [Cyclobacteriaceae bacterium]
MMKGKLLALFFSTWMVFVTQAQHVPFDHVRKNLREYYLSDQKLFEDVLSGAKTDFSGLEVALEQIKSNRKLDSETANEYMVSITSEGYWPDIDYKDKSRSGWSPQQHTARVFFLTRIYFDHGSNFYKDRRLNEILHVALQYWFENKPVSDNWWHNEIGTPRNLGPVFVLLKEDLSEKEKAAALEVMSQSTFGMTGQNKVWLAGNVFIKALLEENEALAMRARDSIVSEIYFCEKEGIKSDYSFHQHGPQQQFGNYGLSFVNSMTFWARIFSQTPLAIEETKLEILRNLLLNGYNWIAWKGHLDINTLGRQLFKNTQESKALSLANAMLDMIVIDPRHKQDYLDFITHNFSIRHDNHLKGNRHFWQSDLTIHRGQGWYSSVKMSSERVIGIESGNGENLKGYHLADGATYILREGDEYKDIFPLWDWRKIPGTTTPRESGPLKHLSWSGYRNQGDFTGGVSSHELGITAIHFDRDSLTAKKAWFFLDNMMICLGSSIQTHKNVPVTSTINQCHQRGEIVYSDGKTHTIDKTDEIISENLKWIFHNGIGYCFLQPANIRFSARIQQGDWHDIATMYNSSIVFGKIFTLEVDHGTRPENASYSYAIIPGTTVGNMERLSLNFTVLQNNNQCQALVANDNNTLMFAIHQPQTVDVPGAGSFTFEQAGLYLFERIENGWKISLSDPTRKLTGVKIVIGTTAFTLELPKGEQAGSTLTTELITVQTTSKRKKR